MRLRHLHNTAISNRTRRHNSLLIRKSYGSGHAGTSVAMMCVLILLLALSACGTKKNTATSRQWQAFTTRYNVYYNGNEHYLEQIKEMESKYEDDYTRLLLTHPAEARADNKLPQPSGDFKRTIEKMQKAIQLHSIKKKPPKKSGSQKEKAFRAREEFNPFLHNAWMRMGEGQFMNGDFLGAAATFYYVSRHFKWLPKTTTEAELWQARSYCAMDWLYEAENALRQVKEKDLTTKQLRNLYNITQADFLVRSKRWADAVPFLTEAARAAKGSQKNRLWFLLGQVYVHLGQRDNAYRAFKKAGSGISTNYRTKFNARIKQSEVFTGSNIAGEVRSLRSMTRYERNKEFLDQIYYAIGNLYLSRGDTAQALKNYSTAVEKSTRNGIDKALAQIALGNLYFAKGDYVKAQPCYSEAVPLLTDNYPDYKTYKLRSDVLDELAVYAGNVELQDSLLELAAMPEAARLEVCERLAKEFIKKEKEAKADSARQEALSKIEDNTLSTGASINMPNSDKSWYFYNQTAKNAGKTEFQRRWGSRKLEDDWRRRNKTSFSFDDTEAEQATDSVAEQIADLTPEQQDSLQRESNPRFAEFYLRQIPVTEEQKQVADDVVMEGLYNMGIILKDKLDDYTAARNEFNELDRRYPDNIYRLDAYYNMYLMAVRRDERAEAENWRRRIISDFPESAYAKAMADPEYFNNLRRMNAVQEELYEDAYTAYLNNRNNQVHELTARMEKDYPLSKILPKFVFIDALSYLTQNDYSKFKERLNELLKKWPDTDMTDMAGYIVRGLEAGRVPHAGESNARGILWDTRLIAGDAPGETSDTPAKFEHDPESPQYLVLAFPRDSVSANQLLFDVARFNFSSFVVKDFDLEPMSFGNVGLLIIKGFENIRQLEHYRNVMAQYDFRLPAGVRPITISKPNFELLLREGRSFEEYFRFEEQAKVEEQEQKVLGEDTPEEEESPRENNSTEEQAPDEGSSETSIEEAPESTNTPEEEEPTQSPARG